MISRSDKNNEDTGVKRGRNPYNHQNTKFKLTNGNLTTEILKDESSVLNRSMSNFKPRRSIRDMFAKVIPNTKLEAIEAKSKASPGGFFSQMISSIMDETVAGNAKPVTVTTAMNIKPGFNEVMDKHEEITASISNTISAYNLMDSDSITRDRPRVSFKTDIPSSDNYEFKPLFISKLKQANVNSNANANANASEGIKTATKQKDHLDSIAKTFKINVILDESTHDYEFKPLFFSKNNEKNGKGNTHIEDKTNHLKSIANTFKINVLLDNSDDGYEYKNLVYKKDGQVNNTSSNNVASNTNVSNPSNVSVSNVNSKNNSSANKGFMVNVLLDDTEDSYECTNLVYKKNDNGNNTVNNQNSGKINNHVNKNDNTSNGTKSMSNGNTFENENSITNIALNRDQVDEHAFTAEMTKEIEQDLILKISEINKILPSRNLIENKKKKEFDIKKHFENLVADYKERVNSRVFTIIRELKNELFKIAISYGVKDGATKGIYLRLYKVISTISTGKDHRAPSSIAENFISFEKLKSFSTKIAIYNSLPDNKDINKINSLDLFIEKIFIYHCYIFSKDQTGNILLGVLTRPLGICFNRAYEFSFLKTSCLIDIFILQSKEVKFFIYNKTK
jgi:hypothetical protein